MAKVRKPKRIRSLYGLGAVRSMVPTFRSKRQTYLKVANTHLKAMKDPWQATTNSGQHSNFWMANVDAAHAIKEIRKIEQVLRQNGARFTPRAGKLDYDRRYYEKMGLAAGDFARKAKRHDD